MRIGCPFHHRAGKQARRTAEQLVQHEPVGRGPMTGVAVTHRRSGRKPRRDSRQFGFRLQPVGLLIVELAAVEADRAGNMAIGPGVRRLLLAGEERRRPRIDQRGAAGGRDLLDLGNHRAHARIDGGGKDPRRRRRHAALDRHAGFGPGRNAAIEDRDVFHADIFQRPIGARAGPEVEHAHAGRHHDDLRVLVDAEVADQLFKLGRRRHHERHVVAGYPPAVFVVVAVYGARNMGGLVGLGAAAVDGRADIEHDQV